MADPFNSTTIQSGIEFDKYMSDIKYKYQWNDAPFGYQIDNTLTDPKVSFIDKYENVCTPPTDFFYNHELFLWTKCLLSEAGVVTEDKEKDRNGVNLDKTGASGDVMTWIPNGQYCYKWEPDADVQLFKFAPYYSNHRGFDYHPACYMGGGTKHDHFFIGTYKAGLKDDGGTLKFNSCAGVQPWTGEQMRSIPFTAGSTGFTVGETITGSSGATGTVVSWHKSEGDWTDGSAVGKVYIRNYGVDVSAAPSFVNGETITWSSGSATTSGGSATLELTLSKALTYAGNKGAGWTVLDIYSLGWIQGLLYAQWGTRNSQLAVGKGVVNRSSGNGYAGLLNGADDVDNVLNSYGTGMNTSNVNGQTPIEVNNICDIWGNGWEFVAGINFMADKTYRLTLPNGTGTIADVLPADNYIVGSGVSSSTTGYIKSVQKTDKYGAITWIPEDSGGTGSGNNYGFCDYWTPSAVNTSVMIYGHYWGGDLPAGIAYRDSNCMTAYSNRAVGARLKYVPQS